MVYVEENQEKMEKGRRKIDYVMEKATGKLRTSFYSCFFFFSNFAFQFQETTYIINFGVDPCN